MKKGKIFTNCLMSVWALIMLVSFASCSADGSDIINEEVAPVSTVETSFSVILKAYSEGEDITAKGDVNNTTLFVFDKNNDFFKQISIDGSYLLQAKQVQIECPGSDRITIIAWSGISNESENISTMSQANIISDLQIALKQNNGIVSNLPGDLFYGQVTVNRATPATKANAQTLKIERKVSSLALSTKGIIKVFDSKEGSYFYKVKNTKGSFNHNGELTGADVEYIITASLDKNGNLVSDKTSILPSTDITVELYKDNNLIMSNKNEKNNEKVAVNAGEQANIIFDLSRKEIKFAVTSWGSVSQIVTVS